MLICSSAATSLAIRSRHMRATMKAVTRLSIAETYWHAIYFEDSKYG
jgi:hypothetical protein